MLVNKTGHRWLKFQPLILQETAWITESSYSLAWKNLHYIHTDVASWKQLCWGTMTSQCLADNFPHCSVRLNGLSSSWPLTESVVFIGDCRASSDCGRDCDVISLPVHLSQSEEALCSLMECKASCGWLSRAQPNSIDPGAGWKVPILLLEYSAVYCL